MSSGRARLGTSEEGRRGDLARDTSDDECLAGREAGDEQPREDGAGGRDMRAARACQQKSAGPAEEEGSCRMHIAPKLGNHSGLPHLAAAAEAEGGSKNAIEIYATAAAAVVVVTPMLFTTPATQWTSAAVCITRPGYIRELLDRSVVPFIAWAPDSLMAWSALPTVRMIFFF